MAVLACSSSNKTKDNIYVTLSSTSVNYYQSNDLDIPISMPIHAITPKYTQPYMPCHTIRYWLFDLECSIFQCKQTPKALSSHFSFQPILFGMFAPWLAYYSNIFWGLLSSLSPYFHFLTLNNGKMIADDTQNSCKILEERIYWAIHSIFHLQTDLFGPNGRSRKSIRIDHKQWLWLYLQSNMESSTKVIMDEIVSGCFLKGKCLESWAWINFFDIIQYNKLISLWQKRVIWITL